MNTNLSDYFEVIDRFFLGKDYYLSDIPGGVSFDIKVKASCEDKDYIIKVIEGKVSASGNLENRVLWYQTLAKIRQNHNYLLVPIWCKIYNGHIVTVTDWIYGEQLDSVFKANPELMVSIGKRIGKYIREIHNQEFVKNTLKDKGVTINPAIISLTETRINEVCSNGITFASIDKAIDYLKNNLDQISEERAAIVHNDLRPENFILKDTDILLFDFDSGMITDCYGDFTYLTVMSESYYRPFSYALIMSYFNDNIPDDFWKVNLFYSILKLLDYAITKYKLKGTMVIQQAKNFIETFDDYRSVEPTWWKMMDEQFREEYLHLGDCSK